jgi:hypothetical protein
MMSPEPVAPSNLMPRAEHPHRCTAGHRWQHDGPTAVSCTIPTYDRVSGDLPFVSPADCPVCCGRSDLLIRALHAHYCNMCDSEWEHDGRCLDSLAACCPWCFPKTDAERVAGARRGAHFHFCSECGQNWRHMVGCSAPLRAALPECTGCQGPPATRDGAPSAVSSVARLRTGLALVERVRPVAVWTGIAAMVLLSIPLAIKGYSMLWGSMLWGPTLGTSPPVREEHRQAPPIASAPTTPPAPARDLAKPSAASSVTKDVARRETVDRPPAAKAPGPKKETPRAPAVDRVVKQRPASSRPHTDRPREPDVIPHPAISALAPGPAVPAPPVTPPRPLPSMARSEIVPDPAPAWRESPPAASESAAIRSTVQATFPSIRGAPPFSGMNGSSGPDNSLDGHPRRVTP